MIRGVGPGWQALLGSLLTWGLTALGAGGVWVLRGESLRVLDGSLGFAAGVMTAASFWSLLAPALELASSTWGHAWSWVPVAVGLALGAAFVHAADALLPQATAASGLASPPPSPPPSPTLSPEANNNLRYSASPSSSRRRKPAPAAPSEASSPETSSQSPSLSWRRVLLLIIAITVHNIPEGLAVGVGFGAVERRKAARHE
jgi:zinc transporter 11